jgi:hypothetical protein
VELTANARPPYAPRQASDAKRAARVLGRYRDGRHCLSLKIRSAGWNDRLIIRASKLALGSATGFGLGGCRLGGGKSRIAGPIRCILLTTALIAGTVIWRYDTDYQARKIGSPWKRR